MNKIKRGDTVLVITGKEKGKKGTVQRVLDQGARVVLEGLNLAKKHVKPNPQLGIDGGIQDIAMPLQTSNVAIYNAATGKPDRVGFKFLEDGRKVRVFKSNNEMIDS